LERLDALQRVNADLAKKLVEAERTLQRKLADHEVDLEEMEARLEEAKSELSAAKREEKELRGKERSNQNQIAALESEIAKVQKTLDDSRTMYNSLQKQYQEQLSM
jgi:chromosome segregation ATPase